MEEQTEAAKVTSKKWFDSQKSSERTLDTTQRRQENREHTTMHEQRLKLTRINLTTIEFHHLVLRWELSSTYYSIQRALRQVLPWQNELPGDHARPSIPRHIRPRRATTDLAADTILPIWHRPYESRRISIVHRWFYSTSLRRIA